MLLRICIREKLILWLGAKGQNWAIQTFQVACTKDFGDGLIDTQLSCKPYVKRKLNNLPKNANLPVKKGSYGQEVAKFQWLEK